MCAVRCRGRGGRMRRSFFLCFVREQLSPSGVSRAPHYTGGAFYLPCDLYLVSFIRTGSRQSYYIGIKVTNNHTKYNSYRKLFYIFLFYKTVPHTAHQEFLLDRGCVQTAKPETITFRSYKYLFRTSRSNPRHASQHSIAAPTANHCANRADKH